MCADKCNCGESGCQCHGSQRLVVTLEMGPRDILPCTLENLGNVNCIHYGKRKGNLELCVGDPPAQQDAQFDCIQLAADGQLNFVPGFSLEAQAAVVRLIQTITGQQFIVGDEDECSIMHWREDLAEQIAALKKTK
jgi:hypothetical protein